MKQEQYHKSGTIAWKKRVAFKFSVITLFLFTLLSIPFTPSAQSQCEVETLHIATGINPITDAEYAIGTPDPYWRQVNKPTTADPDLDSPGPAWVISTFVAWDDLPTAQWLSWQPDDSYDVNNHRDSDEGPFSFEREFCVESNSSTGTTIDYDFDIHADNNACVYIDDILIWCHPSLNITANFLNPPESMAGSMVLADGIHTIRVDLYNESGVAMGFALEGDLTGYLLTDSCCEEKALIYGHKYQDVNCDGILDDDDIPLEDWTIDLSGDATGTETTDLSGLYDFIVSPGTYTVSEFIEAGWTPTSPLGGSETITVVAGETYLIDFLNCPPPCAEFVNKQIECRMGTDGSIIYEYCFNVVNLSTVYQIDGIDLEVASPPGVTVAPGSLTFVGGIPPFSASTEQCVNISGPGATPGTWVYLDIIVNQSDGGLETAQCQFRDSIQLPDCPLLEDSCCTIEHLSFDHLMTTTEADGVVTLSGLSYVGPNPIKSVHATLVSCYVNGEPVFGEITGGTYGGFTGIVQPMHEVGFGPWMPCQDFASGAFFQLGMNFPSYTNPCPGVPGGCPDTLEFCVRLRYCDCNCCVRDTLLCFTVVRFPPIGEQPKNGERYEDLMFHREGSEGGDVIKETNIGVKGASTCALHLQNTNWSEEPIDRVVLEAEKGIRVVGVGSTRNDSEMKRMMQGENLTKHRVRESGEKNNQ